MAGEDAQLKGRDGLYRAKRWLEMTTRVSHMWTNEDEPLKELLTFDWPHGEDFSFDLGGKFRGGDLEGAPFLAEVKAYRYESDLPTHFKAFMAKCYIAMTTKPKRCGHFLWISWAPFQAQKWHTHTSAESVKGAVLKERQRIFGTPDGDYAQKSIDIEAVAAVARKTWLLTLCEQQEELVLAPEHYSDIDRLLRVREREN